MSSRPACTTDAAARTASCADVFPHRSPAPQAEIEALAWVDPAGPYPVTVAPLSADHILPALFTWQGKGVTASS